MTSLRLDDSWLTSPIDYPSQRTDPQVLHTESEERRLRRRVGLSLFEGLLRLLKFVDVEFELGGIDFGPLI